MDTMIAAITVLLFASVFGEIQKWEFPQSNPCIMVDWDFDNVTLRTVVAEGSKAVISGHGTVSNTSSSCTPTLSSLSVDLQQSVKMVFTFTSSSTGETVMDATLQFKPEDFFNNGSSEAQTLNMVGNNTLAPKDKAYVCERQVQLIFKAPGSSYEAFVNVKNAKIQAFVNGSFSDETLSCAAAEVSTAAGPTSEGPTSEGPTSEGPTSEGPTSEGPTSEGPTSASPVTAAPPTLEVYKYPATNSCIILSGVLELDVMYTKTDNSTATVKLGIPKTHTVTGNCMVNNVTNELEVTWGASDKTSSLKFTFVASDTEVTLTTIEASIAMDEEFPNATETEPIKTTGNVNIDMMKPTGYFKCDSQIVHDLKSGVKLSTSFLKVQAVGVKGSNFTGDEQECPADVPQTTTPVVTTVAPPADGSPPVTVFFDPSDPCIVFKAGIQFNIQYMATDSNKTAHVGIPQSSKVKTDCNNDTQTLTIMFYDDWEAQFVFVGDSSSTSQLAADVSDFYLQNVSITYNASLSKIFPDSKETGMKTVKTKLSDGTYKASKDGSYMCEKELKLTLNNGIEMDTYSLQYEAFRSGNSTDFSTDKVSECSQDTSTNSVVPIAVGAALAGLVIIVLIAYLIGRRKSRRGYEHV